MGRLERTFSNLKQRGEKSLITYLMAGDPNLLETERLVLALVKAGADIIELGVPFSDPIADGPIIQQASERALRSGTSLARVLSLIASLRGHTEVPIVMMLYYNSIHAMGVEAFCARAKSSGVDGVIVPDLPPDEAQPLAYHAESAGLPLIFLLAPTSTARRRQFVASHSRGFIYYVSLTGITGAKLSDLSEVRRNVDKIKEISSLPVAVGFGVASPEAAAQVANIADGVIVGSAIVKRIASTEQGDSTLESVTEFVQSLKSAMVAGAAPL